ncbi:hypothetical protein GGF47_003626, partial [Coemansia sp. RSA 2524]
VPLTYWHVALDYAALIYNSTLKKTLNMDSPMARANGKVPTAYLQPFGCLAY